MSKVPRAPLWWALCVCIVMLTGGCSTVKPVPVLFAFAYESPRPWGFEWSAVVLRDGLVMLQPYADEVEYYQMSHSDTEQLVCLAQLFMNRTDGIANVVEATNGRFEWYTTESVSSFDWDERVEPQYGFTSRSEQRTFDRSLVFVQRWTELKSRLAGAIARAKQLPAPGKLSSREDKVLEQAKSRWNHSRPWWSELVEGAIRSRQMPLDSP